MIFYGTSTSFDIDSKAKLILFSQLFNDSKFSAISPKVSLSTDITFSSSDTMPSIGTKYNPYRGTFEGKGCGIYNLKQSLFGNIDGATIKNVCVEYSRDVVEFKNDYDNNIYDYTDGCIAKYANGTCSIENCLVIPKSGDSIRVRAIDNGVRCRLGGIIGAVEGGNVTVKNCAANCNFDAEIGGSWCFNIFSIGGIIGEICEGATATISDSHYKGYVNMPVNESYLTFGGIANNFGTTNINRCAVDVYGTLTQTANTYYLSGVGHRLSGYIQTAWICPSLTSGSGNYYHDAGLYVSGKNNTALTKFPYYIVTVGTGNYNDVYSVQSNNGAKSFSGF